MSDHKHSVRPLRARVSPAMSLPKAYVTPELAVARAVRDRAKAAIVTVMRRGVRSPTLMARTVELARVSREVQRWEWQATLDAQLARCHATVTECLARYHARRVALVSDDGDLELVRHRRGTVEPD